MRFGVRFDTKQQTGGSGEEPPVSSILESNSAKLRAKNSVLQSKMNNLCQISRQIFRRSFSRNSARYKTFMFLCQAPRLCQIDRLPCDDAPQERTVRRGAFLFRGHHSPASRIASPSVSIGSPSVNGDSSPSGNHRTLSVSPGASSSPGLPRERATTMFSPLKASP